MADETEIEGMEISFLEKIPDPYKVLFSGGVAGSVAKSVTAPLSRITILFQVNSLVKAGVPHKKPDFAKGLVPAFRKILEREGLTAFWKGNLTSICHRFPYSGINFVLYEKFKPVIAEVRGKDSSETPFTRFLAGASAGALAATACYPMDLVRTRLATQRYEVYYRGIIHAFQRISQEEGVTGLYRGLGTTLAVAVPNLAISLMTYHGLKDKMTELKTFGSWFRTVHVNENTDEIEIEPSVLGTLLCGSLSGIFSSLITFPIDVIRRRMQIEGLMEHKGAVQPHGPLDELKWIMKKEGVGGLYRGLNAELLKVVPMVGTTFLTYETMKDLLNVC
mmetsp:Transcript_20608/g.27152  ORF Transcript_20608/g.27152 Transcript_20608/m.27152 type:complete len:334 (+) Transcript_20608:81-1082(+)|eukprot:CAMPEP_0117754912 /NCGR_PEP_ID=MMETSP0947-20121206/13132_1 /TAXON_ID=44440 /ORGANISM="Chattonella subsalsa, Strain CCMP2191" /LENGTH=333 /DNA_ID=CAMNT_0005574133 /DNA_START=509 /DNA_END=1510 /DNA_ORIENTATION=+